MYQAQKDILHLVGELVQAFYEEDTLTAAVIAGQLSVLIEQYFEVQRDQIQ